MIDEKKLIEELRMEYECADDLSDFTCGAKRGLVQAIYIIKHQPKVGEWIPVEERFPEEHELIDDETGYYNKSDNVLCCSKNEYNEVEYWIDYTIDGEWQYSEYIDGDEKYWRPLPEPFKGETE